jgi:hypothetical protein
MITLIKIIFSGNFWIGAIIGILSVVGYLYSVNGVDLKWKK